MSAYVTSKEDISVLVAAGLQLAGDESPPASLIGQRLLDECIASVSYRYPDSDLGDLPGTYPEETICPGIAPLRVAEYLTPYTYAAPDHPVTREEVESTISSYEYQSCEHPDWEGSWARSYCVALSGMLGQLPAEPEPETDTLDPAEFEQTYGDLSRTETIKRIRSALKRRSGKAWSVTGGRGTAYGWISIQSPPKRRTGAHVQREGAELGEYEHVDTGEAREFGSMTPADCAELAELLGKDRPVHHQGESIPSGHDYYREYIDRAEGRTASKYGVQYWD